MIIPIKDTRIAECILPLMQKIPNMIYPVMEYFNYISECLDSDASLLLVDVDESGQAKSFIYTESMISITEKEALVFLAYYDPRNKKIGKELQDFVEKWAILRDCKRISIMCEPKREKAYKRKYGFTHGWMYLTKPIGVYAHEGTEIGSHEDSRPVAVSNLG